ncbi:YjgB family protein [Peptococcaceae bacterium 1198_IL3148]
MLKKVIVMILCLSLIVIGCTNSEKDAKADSGLIDFKALIQSNASAEEVAGFINTTIKGVSKEDASEMVNDFERFQKDKIVEFEKIIFENETQTKLFECFKTHGVINQANIPDDAELKEMLSKIENSGYKIETAEGMFFPVIDYQFYKNFSTYVTDDMKEYIEIMAEESTEVPAKDGALVIGWDQLLNRAISQERFLTTYTNSIKINEVQQLHNNYILFTFYGLNNTPLFDYHSQIINADAKEVYLNAVKDIGSSEHLKALKGFVAVLKDNDYKLTDEVNRYRDKVTASLTKNKTDTALLDQIIETAHQGQIFNCEFPVETTVIEDVKAKWGEADKEEYIAEAKGTYATYDEQNVVFGFNKGSQIFDVRSYDDSIKEIAMSQVREVLGSPDNAHYYDTEDMLVYQIGEKYQLLFIFPKATPENPDPKLDHYNVFYPHGTVNLMADDPGIKY